MYTKYDQPPEEEIQNPHHGVTFDYYFMGRRQGNQPGSTYVDLILCSAVYDSQNNKYTRKEHMGMDRSQVKSHIENRIRQHLADLGVDPVMVKGLMRDFEVDLSKCREYDSDEFRPPL
ncbi:hypothetical protein APR41_02190 [Salegentibacter salinarum]|uniref:Uncharacterized protein n=1 Tax=Salegentibacter salinarum TaxID=447422 RepID=A0A2N0U461_9FLAO|nr:hypothetical protein [Salegentibacter salinarum]PKD21811.1 hypothetical protein APR41_02190 [Salegentibacter salinarum]SKB33405.1 hypothetical protein SAMN05660903_00120 [Salegentibacter salinarum]